MAIGLLGAVSTNAAGSPAVVYTVPSGISHAVVHITCYNSSGPSSSSGYVTVNDFVVLTPLSNINGYWDSNSVSMMLSPGDVVRVSSSGPSVTHCTVSGYEVL